ncbi:MAG: hypothetical protein WA144_05590, partial [Candidatus Methanoperedens sp.]
GIYRELFRFYVQIIELRLNSSMIWREMINKSCVIWCFANIKNVAWGSVVLQERLNPRSPEGMVIFALNLFKASTAPDEGSKEKKI